MLVAVVVLWAVLTLGVRASLWRRVGGAPASAAALVTVACLLSAISSAQYKAPVGVAALRYCINMQNPVDQSAVDMEAQKTVRASAKRAVTKQINAIRQKFAENETDSIPAMVEHLKQKFKSFLVAHETYVDLVSEENLDECDKYFYQVQGNYISVLKEVNASKVGTSQGNGGDETCYGANGSLLSCGSDDSHEQMIALTNLPKVELQTFDGNPARYHSFTKSFDANVDKVCRDPDLKLTRLLQYVTGTALEAIRSCQLIGGLKGYDRAYPNGPEAGREAGWGSEFVPLKKREVGSFILLHKISRTACCFGIRTFLKQYNCYESATNWYTDHQYLAQYSEIINNLQEIPLILCNYAVRSCGTWRKGPGQSLDWRPVPLS